MGQFSSSSEAQIAFVEESTWGVTPTTPVFQRIRSTGEGLSSGLESETSAEFSPVPDVTDLIITGASADGDINFELSHGVDFSTLFAHGLRASWDEFGQLVAAAEQKSMSIEKRFAVEGGYRYFRYTGCRVNGLSVNVVKDAKFEGTIEVMGKTEENIDTDILAGATYLLPNSNPVMSAPQIRNVTVGVAGDYVFSDTSFSIDNAARSQTGFQTGPGGPFPDLTAKGIAYGTREITGSLTAYFADEGLYNTFKDNLYTWLMFDLSDGDKSYRVFFPRVKFSEGQTNASDNNSDVESALKWQAILSQDFNTGVIMTSIDNVSTPAIDIIRTSGADAGFGRYFATDELINAKKVYLSYDQNYALWYDSTNWNVTTVADKVAQDNTNSYTTASDVEAAAVPATAWAGQGTFVGSDVRSDLFDSTTQLTESTDFVVVANDA